MTQPKRQLERSSSSDHKLRARAGSHLPRLVGKIRRFLGPRSTGAEKAVKREQLETTMPCSHAKLRQSCSNDCCLSQSKAVQLSLRRPPLQKSNSSGSSANCSYRTSPAISDSSRSSVTSSSASSSSTASGEKRLRFTDEVLIRDACSRDDVTSLTCLLDDLACRNSSLVERVRQNAYGRTLLHEAANKGSAEMVEMLLRYGLDPNAPDSNGDRPLHAAASRGSYEIAERLLVGGAKVHLFNSDLELPVDISRGRMDHRMVKLLSDAAHAQAAFECYQARRDAGMLGPHMGRLRSRRPSIDGAMQTLSKAQQESERARTALRRLASDEPPQYRSQDNREHYSQQSQLSPRILLSHQSGYHTPAGPTSGASIHQTPGRVDRPHRASTNIAVSRAGGSAVNRSTHGRSASPPEKPSAYHPPLARLQGRQLVAGQLHAAISTSNSRRRDAIPATPDVSLGSDIPFDVHSIEI